MLEVIYRIYEVADEETASKRVQLDRDVGALLHTSRSANIELLMDVCICDSREHFKSIIRDMYGADITFRYSKSMKPGQLYCIIIGEHCYNTETYFNRISFKCDYCGSEILTYTSRFIGVSEYDISHKLYGMQEHSCRRFCSNHCRDTYIEMVSKQLKPDDDAEFFITKDMFTESVSGYIYKITKKSSGEFYVGQTTYVPVFRWGQHLKTNRFPVKDIEDYIFEVIEIVPKGENILEREKYHIHVEYAKNPKLCLNIQHVSNTSKTPKLFTNFS